MLTQGWEDQLILSQPEGADCAPKQLLAHSALGSFLRLWYEFSSM